MALTINPAVSRTRSQWISHILAFFVGSLLGALVSLACVLIVVALLQPILPENWLRIGLTVPVGIAVLHDLGLPFRLPYRQQQVPEWLRDALPQGAVAFAYGFMLGVGFLTLFTYSAHVAMLASLPLLQSFLAMFAVVALFAFGKTIVLGAALGVASLDEISPRFAVDRNRIRLLRLTTAITSAALGSLIAAHL